MVKEIENSAAHCVRGSIYDAAPETLAVYGVYMFRRLILGAAITLFPIMAHALQPSTDLSKDVSVSVLQPGSTVCGGQAPKPAQAAGFTKLAFCSDFTQPEYANLSNWLGYCGATNPKQWWLTNWFGQGPGDCKDVGMVVDGGVQAFHMQYTTTDWANQEAPNSLYTCNVWSSPTKDCRFTFTAPIYAEITFRVGQGGLDNGKTDCSNRHCLIIAFWASWNG